MSNLINHANTEFRAAGWTDGDGKFNDKMQEAICKHVLKLLEVFSDEGHSGFSAPYTIETFSTLAKFEPLVPLTGEDWEWMETSENIFQNIRCSHVFRDSSRFDGQAYDIEGIVFYDYAERKLEADEDGFPGTYRYKSYYTCKESAIPVTFPYTPKIEYKERNA